MEVDIADVLCQHYFSAIDLLLTTAALKRLSVRDLGFFC